MEIYTWAESLYNFFVFTSIIPMAVGVVKRRLFKQREKWILGFLCALLAHEVLSIVCIEFHIRNHFLYYLQTITVGLCIAGFYDSSIGPKGLIWRLLWTLFLGTIAEVTLFVGFNHINSITLTLSRLLGAVFALISLNQVFHKDAAFVSKLNAYVYFHLGFFLFGAFTAVNTYFKSYFIENSLDLYYLFNTLSAMISAISFCLFTIGFWRLGSVRIINH